MAIVNKMELGRELMKTIAQINLMIDEIKDAAEKMGREPIQIRDSTGNWVYIPVLAAKAQCLHALAIINQRD